MKNHIVVYVLKKKTAFAIQILEERKRKEIQNKQEKRNQILRF